MSTRGANALTYADWASRTDETGKTGTIVELLEKNNPIVTDAAVVEANEVTGHKTIVRTGYPTVAWRLFNYGVQPSKSRTKTVTDTIGMLEAYAEVDKDLADLNGNTAAFRLSEDRAFLEQMNRTMATTIFYGNTATHPERFTGLAPRYGELSTDEDSVGFNIVDAEGTGSDNTSLWIVDWSDMTIFMTFPKSGKAGFQHRDLGEDTLEDENGGKYQGYRSHYKWNAGFVVRDWRYAVRVANIDVPAIATAGASGYSGPDLILKLIEAQNKLPDIAMGQRVIYANRNVVTALDKLAASKSNVYLTTEEYAGKKVTHFRGIPVRRVDALVNNEDRVV